MLVRRRALPTVRAIPILLAVQLGCAHSRSTSRPVEGEPTSPPSVLPSIVQSADPHQGIFTVALGAWDSLTVQQQLKILQSLSDSRRLATRHEEVVVRASESDLAIYDGRVAVYRRRPTDPAAAPEALLRSGDRLESGDPLPVLQSLPPPAYPAIARRQEVQGTVELAVLVGASGQVLAVYVLESVPELDEAALAAAKGAVFEPYTYRGRPARAWVHVPIRFTLN